MSALVEEEFLVFKPTSGVFDIDAVARRIAELGSWFRDEADPTRYVVTGDAALRDEFQRRRLEDPESPFPYVLLVRLTPERIVVTPSTFEDEKSMSLALIDWIMASYPCQITNEYGMVLPIAAES